MKVVEDVFASLLAVHPYPQSFRNLVMPKTPVLGGRHAIDKAIQAVDGDPCLVCAAYLYLDDIAGAHRKVESMESNEEAAMWHAIVHRRDADFNNSKYWTYRAAAVPGILGSEVAKLTDRAEAAYKIGGPYPEHLLDDVRAEWRKLTQVGLDRLFG